MKLHRHDWVKLDPVPLHDFFDYSGIRVCVFRCACRKCGKARERKYMDVRTERLI